MTRNLVNVLRKNATSQYKPGMFDNGATIGEALLGVPGGMVVPGTGKLGNLLGYLSADENPDSLKSFNASALIPGMSSYRNTKRQQLIDKTLSKGKRRNSAILSERFGYLTSPIVLAALAGLTAKGVGKLTGMSSDESTDLGLKVGLGGGILGAGASVGGLLGGLIRGKNAPEHKKYLDDEHLVAKNLLIPGMSSYNRGARINALLKREL